MMSYCVCREIERKTRNLLHDRESKVSEKRWQRYTCSSSLFLFRFLSLFEERGLQGVFPRKGKCEHERGRKTGCFWWRWDTFRRRKEGKNEVQDFADGLVFLGWLSVCVSIFLHRMMTMKEREKNRERSFGPPDFEKDTLNESHTQWAQCPLSWLPRENKESVSLLREVGWDDRRREKTRESGGRKPRSSSLADSSSNVCLLVFLRDETAVVVLM